MALQIDNCFESAPASTKISGAVRTVGHGNTLWSAAASEARRRFSSLCLRISGLGHHPKRRRASLGAALHIFLTTVSIASPKIHSLELPVMLTTPLLWFAMRVFPVIMLSE